MKEGVDVPSDVFLMSETYKCIRKEIETVEYLMRVRKDVDSELTVRISTKDQLKKRLDDVLGLEKTMHSKLQYVKVQNEIDLEQLE